MTNGMRRMTTDERLDKIEGKLDDINNIVIRLTVWETIGKMSLGALLSGAFVEVIHYLGLIKP